MSLEKPFFPEPLVWHSQSKNSGVCVFFLFRLVLHAYSVCVPCDFVDFPFTCLYSFVSSFLNAWVLVYVCVCVYVCALLFVCLCVCSSVCVCLNSINRIGRPNVGEVVPSEVVATVRSSFSFPPSELYAYIFLCHAAFLLKSCLGYRVHVRSCACLLFSWYLCQCMHVCMHECMNVQKCVNSCVYVCLWLCMYAICVHSNRCRTMLGSCLGVLEGSGRTSVSTMLCS